jgi:hypothetical protein
MPVACNTNECNSALVPKSTKPHLKRVWNLLAAPPVQGSFSFPNVPPDSSLVYEVELLEWEPPEEVWFDHSRQRCCAWTHALIFALHRCGCTSTAAPAHPCYIALAALLHLPWPTRLCAQRLNNLIRCTTMHPLRRFP